MNKNILLTLTLLLFCSIGFSQDYLEKITLKSCECANNIPDTLETSQFNMKLGLCMINSAAPYSKTLKKNHDIDFDNIDLDGEKLGTLIGKKMITLCPDALMRVTNKVNEKKENKITENIFTGKIINIDNNKFVEFSIKNDTGKILKFYWFTFVEANIELTNNYEQLLDHSVEIKYINQEFFDARINEYRSFNVIIEIIVIQE